MPVSDVTKNIVSIFERRRAAVYALCLSYAARALNMFRDAQQQEIFWNNQTGQAYARVFADAYMGGAFGTGTDVVGWFMAHGVQYGVYLELANDRRHEALRPIIQALLSDFQRDLKELYA